MTKIQSLRNVLGNMLIEDTKEANELLDSIEKDFDNREEDIEAKPVKASPDMNKSFLGLDTLHWYLENENLKIEQQVEHFIHCVQKQNAVIPS